MVATSSALAARAIYDVSEHGLLLDAHDVVVIFIGYLRYAPDYELIVTCHLHTYSGNLY